MLHQLRICAFLRKRNTTPKALKEPCDPFYKYSVVQVEMLEDHVYNNPQPLSSFEKVSLQMLQDIQERLIYRTYIYIRSDILSYKPAPGDLAYPEKLVMMQVR